LVQSFIQAYQNANTMNAKLLFRSLAGMLFLMLLFSKPYIANCQTAPTDNAPVNKEVRIEIDSLVDAYGNVNVERAIFIDGKQPQTEVFYLVH
jgi:hypothetical protein